MPPTTANAMVTGDPRSRRRAQTQDEILDAAWRLAEHRGIAGISLRDLAHEVGLRAPSLYTYFANKAAIYDAMFAAGYRQLDATMADVAIEAGDPVASITRAIEAFLDFCRASVPRYQLLFTRAIPDWEPSAAAYAVSVSSYGRMEAQLAPLGVTDPGALDLLTALTAGLAAQQLANDPEGDRWQRRGREAAEMFVAHVLEE